jgi:DNA-binding transcriptional LysR family regulator
MTGERMCAFGGAAGAERLQLLAISEEPLVVVLPEGHPVADQAEVDLGILKNEPFLQLTRSVISGRPDPRRRSREIHCGGAHWESGRRGRCFRCYCSENSEGMPIARRIPRLFETGTAK